MMKILEKDKTRETLPVVPTMDVVVFPRMIVPLLVLDKRIIAGVEDALKNSKMIIVLATNKQEGEQGAISTKDLFKVGTVASIMRLVNLPEGGVKILVQGMYKAKVKEIQTSSDFLKAEVEKVEFDMVKDSIQIEAEMKNIRALIEKMNSTGQFISPDLQVFLSRTDEPEKLIDFIISHLNLNVEQSQKLLEMEKIEDLLSEVYKLLSRELEVQEVQEQIMTKTRDSLSHSQKEYYLREQLKAIHKELGDDDAEEIQKFRNKLKNLKLPDEALEEVNRQLNRFEKMTSESMESSVIRTYLDCILNLPWNNETKDNLDIEHAKKILDEDHYGLKDIKDRILDFISIRNLRKDGNNLILCLFGPPGTGKTSLGVSIAKSLGRKYVRVSLGGIKDESEIRGHRRTYVGAMPGRFIQGLRKAGSLNPIIVVDEIDKLGSDLKGDPSSAMLEILDPQQNKSFYDNYLGVPFDLSKVIFIATANSLDTISAPLRDRMEIIQLSGYTIEEKLQIAKRHIVKKVLFDSGLEDKNVGISDDVIKDIIMNYTRESGVRQLERTLRKLCSKLARMFVEEHKICKFSVKNLDKFLGPRIFSDDDVNSHDQVGITNGLAWTMYGGEMIRIEAVLMPGKGNLILTGQLGDVMKESAQAALSYARSHASSFGIDEKVFRENDLHIHVPAGGVPKDGPSAGVTMLTSILSVLTGRLISSDYAMTGELNLHGDVMPIGGVKEKILAAKRNNISHIIIPFKNKNDLLGIKDAIKDLNIILVNHAEEVLKQVLLPKKKNNIRIR